VRPGPDNARLPHVAREGGLAPTRWRDLPRAEMIRRKVEDTVRYYGQRYGRVLTAQSLGDYMGWKMRYVGELTPADLSAAINDPVTVANLREWGVLPAGVDTFDEYAELGGQVQPTREQMDALDAVFRSVDPADGRSLETILNDASDPDGAPISIQTWHGWLRDPVFAGYVRDRTAAVFGEQAYRVDIALLRKATAGDVAAIKLILELQGRLRDETAVSPQVLLSRVLDVIRANVSDRATLVAIAEGLETISQQASRGQLQGQLSGPAALGFEPAVIEGHTA
jgi:hypothetical protein